MTHYRRGVWPVVVVASSLLLTACATASKEPTVRTWSYATTQLEAFWWYKTVDVGGAHAKAMGTDRTIAIVDTGVSKDHEDLARVLPGVATCGSDAANTMDRNGHGTQLAGIAVGKDPMDHKAPHNTQGLAPAAGLIPIKVDCGRVSAASLTQGVDRAIEKKPDIILIALGGYPTDLPDVHVFLNDRVRNNPGILFVVASIWDGSAQYRFPPWTRQGNAIVVAAMTLDRPGKDANEVPYNDKLGDIWAPGRDVETADSLVPNAGYSMQGTSAASAIVAGCAALVKEKQPGYTGAQLKTALIAAAEAKPQLGPTNNKRLNCNKAVP